MLSMDRRKFLGQMAACPLLAASSQARAQTTAVNPYADAKLVSGEPPLPASGSFTIAVLPDTQFYSETYPESYLQQTRWIVENKAKRNIAGVLHLGDITNRNTPREWQNAAKAMKQLDGHLPYFFCTGNHDYGAGGGCKDRATHLNTYFPVAQFKGRPTFGGTYDREPERMENSYHLFSAGGRDFLVLALEFGPRADVVRWANEIAHQYAQREAILITHALIYFDDTRYDWKKYGAKQRWNPHAYGIAKASQDDVLDGEELWDQLLSRHENFILTLNGHVLERGLGKVITTTPAGRDVPQLLVNFQMKPHGGDGWLRLLEFRADRRTIDVYDYSPILKQRNESVNNQFSLTAAPVKTV